jgi:hypothetical protein
MPATVKITYEAIGEAGAAASVSRMRTHLQDLGRSADGAGTALTDRLGSAFQHLEQREPTMVIRRVRMAVEEMSASALGATGPMGRLLASFGLLIPGGALTIGVVAGLAGIALEIKKILDFSGQMDTALLKQNEGFARLGGSAAQAAFQLGQAQARLEKLSKPSFAESALSLVNYTSGPGDLSVAMQTQRLSELATQENLVMLMVKGLHQLHDAMGGISEPARASAQALDDAAIGLARAKLTAEALGRATSPENTVRAALAVNRLGEDIDLMHLGFSRLDEATKTRIGNLIHETAAVERYNIQVRGGTLLTPRQEAYLTQGLAGFGPQQQLSNTTPLLRGGPILPIAQPGGPDLKTMLDRMGAGQPLYKPEEWIAIYREIAQASDEYRQSLLGLTRDTRVATAGIVQAGFAMLQSLLSGGGVGGFISGISGIVTTLTGNPIIGAVGGGIGGIISSFEAKDVNIASVSAGAAQQLQQALKTGPDRVEVVIVSSTGKELDRFLYEAGRRTRLDAVVRIPVGG